MILNVMKYGGIYAKTCALRSRLLTYGDYLALASSGDVKACAELLKEKENYKDSVEEAFFYGAGRVAVERSLIKSLYDDYTAIYGFVTDEGEKKYIDAVILKFAVSMLKSFIRRLYDHRDTHNFVPKYDNAVLRHMKLNIEEMESSESLDDLLESIKASEFYGTLSKLNSDSATLFDYETQLDFHYSLTLQKSAAKYLKGANKKSQRHLNGVYWDLQNIVWIYRAREFYKISSDKIFTYVLPSHYKLKNEDIKAFVTAKDEDEFKAVLGKTCYRNVFSDYSAETIEKDFISYVDKQYGIERKKNPYSLACVFEYLHFKSREIKNLTTLIECVRYNFPPEQTLKKINISHLKAGDSID